MPDLDRQYLRDTAEMIKARLPEHMGFILIATPFEKQGDGRLIYVANIKREDAIASMKEFLLKCGAAEDWMKHIN